MSIKAPIYLIIPVHNRRSVTLECLAKLSQNGDLSRYNTIVIDDGSTDGTDAAICEQYPEVIVLYGDGSLWWTGAIVRGMQHAYEQGAELIIWLNDDCTPHSDALSQLVAFWQQHPQAIIGAACYDAKNSALHATGAKGRQRQAAKPGEVIAVDEMSGHCVAIPIVVMHQIGLPNARRFPHYHGDSMYILRATRSGFPAFILGDAKVDHADLIKSQVHHFIEPTTIKGVDIQTLSATFKTIFLQQKSLYFLPTQFFYYQEKYGIFKGILIFSSKAMRWLFQWLRSTLRLGRLSV